ncbi:hypothetical protein [Paraliobacillus sediminis]|uniref:hypothetical protein n=1 Tax=Paraliobacillus sediminis TaxID=1885916 RepID=UPI000E3BDB34|nr:hypothetical protein [Paraliobacillus sediminis]
MTRIRFSILSFVISGIAFAIYPIIRPFSDELTMRGAVAFASTEWMIAHILAMIAFTFLPIGFLGIQKSLEKTTTNSPAYSAVILSIIGIGFTLPYYGGETFGLHAIGYEALKQQNESLVGLETIVRSGPGLIMFIIGLVLLAISSIIVAITLWKSAKILKWSGVPLAIGMTLYLPQFMVEQPFRVLHGILIAVGCLLIAWELSNQIKLSKSNI